MKTDWVVIKNVNQKGVYSFLKKEPETITDKRIVFKTTARQKAVIKAYCQQNGVEMSSFIRGCIARHLESINFDLP